MNATSAIAPDEILNIYAAIKYLSKEAQTGKFWKVRSILEKAGQDIIALYGGNISPNEDAREFVDSLFLAFTLLLKYLTSESEGAKEDFLRSISAVDNIDLIRKSGVRYV